MKHNETEPEQWEDAPAIQTLIKVMAGVKENEFIEVKLTSFLIKEVLVEIESQIKKTRREARADAIRKVNDEANKRVEEAYEAGLQKAIELIPDSAGASYWHMKEIIKSELEKL